MLLCCHFRSGMLFPPRRACSPQDCCIVGAHPSSLHSLPSLPFSPSIPSSPLPALPSLPSSGLKCSGVLCVWDPGLPLQWGGGQGPHWGVEDSHAGDTQSGLQVDVWRGVWGKDQGGWGLGLLRQHCHSNNNVMGRRLADLVPLLTLHVVLCVLLCWVCTGLFPKGVMITHLVCGSWPVVALM